MIFALKHCPCLVILESENLMIVLEAESKVEKEREREGEGGREGGEREVGRGREMK